MEKKGICGICSAGCWIIADYDDDGRITGVRPDKESEMGIICRLAEHAPEIIYSKDRLLYPMKRKGKKGSYDFERISWGQAYETIVEKLISIKKQYGPEANAIYTGVGSFELSFCDIYQPKGVAVSSASSVLFPFAFISQKWSRRWIASVGITGIRDSFCLNSRSTWMAPWNRTKRWFSRKTPPLESFSRPWY